MKIESLSYLEDLANKARPFINIQSETKDIIPTLFWINEIDLEDPYSLFENPFERK